MNDILSVLLNVNKPIDKNYGRILDTMVKVFTFTFTLFSLCMIPFLFMVFDAHYVLFYLNPNMLESYEFFIIAIMIYFLPTIIAAILFRFRIGTLLTYVPVAIFLHYTRYEFSNLIPYVAYSLTAVTLVVLVCKFLHSKFSLNKAKTNAVMEYRYKTLSAAYSPVCIGYIVLCTFIVKMSSTIPITLLMLPLIILSIRLATLYKIEDYKKDKTSETNVE